MAGNVIGDAALPANTCGREIDFEDLGEELGEFVRLGGEGFCTSEHNGVVGKERGVVFADHGRAGARGRDDGVKGLEDRDQLLGEIAGIVVKAVVVHGLAAAGLLDGKFDGVAKVFKDFHSGYPRAGVVEVGEAGDEESDFHASRE